MSVVISKSYGVCNSYFNLEISHFLSLTDIFFSECQNYQSLNAADRKITYTTYHGYCDASITKGWFVLKGPQDPDCLLHVRLVTGVVLTQPAG